MHTSQEYILARDAVQILSWIAAAVGVWFAALKTLRELSLAAKQRNEVLSQRRSEEKWKRAELARLLHKDALANASLRSALELLEWDGAEYDIPQGQRESVSWKEMENAMRVSNMTFSKKEGFVRRSFDALFDEFAGLEHGLLRGLLDFHDVAFRWRYYVKEVSTHRCFADFLHFYSLADTERFLARFQDTA
jgi:hypothetical protein